MWPGAAIRVVAAPQVVYLSARLGFTLRDDTISYVMKPQCRYDSTRGVQVGHPRSYVCFVCSLHSVLIGSWTRGGAVLGSLTLYTRGTVIRRDQSVTEKDVVTWTKE